MMYLRALGLMLVLIICYNSGHALVTAPDNFSRLSMAVLTAGLVITMAVRRERFIRRDWLTWLAAPLLLGIVLSAVANWESGVIRASMLPTCMILAAYSLVRLIPFDTFARWFLIVMRTIAVVSLIFFLFLPSLWRSLPKSSFININDRIYEHVYFYAELLDPFSQGARNIGVFWEPGLFGSFLVLASFLSIYRGPARLARFDLVLFATAVLSTGSAATYLLFLGALVFFLLLSRSWWMRATAYVGVAAVGVVLLYADGIVERLAEVLPDIFFKFDAENGSFGTRLGSPAANLSIFLENPLFGAGFLEADRSYLEAMDLLGLGAQTSTSSYLLAAMGILGALYTVGLVIGPLRMSGVPLAARLTLAVVLLAIVNKEPHLAVLFTWCLIFYLFNGSASRGQESLRYASSSQASASWRRGPLSTLGSRRRQPTFQA